MQGRNRERWHELCELAANEKDSKKLMLLVEEINRLLAEKHARLKDEARQESALPRK